MIFNELAELQERKNKDICLHNNDSNSWLDYSFHNKRCPPHFVPLQRRRVSFFFLCQIIIIDKQESSFFFVLSPACKLKLVLRTSGLIAIIRDEVFSVIVQLVYCNRFFFHKRQLDFFPSIFFQWNAFFSAGFRNIIFSELQKRIQHIFSCFWSILTFHCRRETKLRAHFAFFGLFDLGRDGFFFESCYYQQLARMFTWSGWVSKIYVTKKKPNKSDSFYDLMMLFCLPNQAWAFLSFSLSLFFKLISENQFKSSFKLKMMDGWLTDWISFYLSLLLLFLLLLLWLAIASSDTATKLSPFEISKPSTLYRWWRAETLRPASPSKSLGLWLQFQRF